MVRKYSSGSFLVIFAVLVAGCATVNKEKELEAQGLKNQISALETQLQSKDEEINGLKENLIKKDEEKVSIGKEGTKNFRRKSLSKRRSLGKIKSRPNLRHVQIALRNAEYDPGVIDGRMGKQTKNALAEFQKAHNLPANGKVDKQTWNLLRDYLYKKLK